MDTTVLFNIEIDESQRPADGNSLQQTRAFCRSSYLCIGNRNFNFHTWLNADGGLTVQLKK
jgi:hypothetical protein